MNKNRKNNNYFENYSKKVFENIVGFLIFAVIIFIGYLIYTFIA